MFNSLYVNHCAHKKSLRWVTAAEGEQFAPPLYKNCKLSWDRNKLCHSKQTGVAEALWRAAEHRLCVVSIITGWAAKTETSDRFDIVYFFICHERFWPENPLSLWHCCVATNPVHDMTCSDLEAAEMSESLHFLQLCTKRSSHVPDWSAVFKHYSFILFPLSCQLYIYIIYISLYLQFCYQTVPS